MAEKHDIAFMLNGKPVSATVEARLHLADFLRHGLRLTGTHVGCEHGVCGACNVMIDGRSVRSCLTLAVQADGADVETIEGLTARGAIADLQREFAVRNALQCGYCTPGMLVTAAELLARGKSSRAQIRAALSGNFCRCTGYQAIVDAIESVAAGRTDAKS
jgi:aerobic carbon-monoxide dehydrogenase small subunit